MTSRIPTGKKSPSGSWQLFFSLLEQFRADVYQTTRCLPDVNPSCFGLHTSSNISCRRRNGRRRKTGRQTCSSMYQGAGFRRVGFGNPGILLVFFLLGGRAIFDFPGRSLTRSWTACPWKTGRPAFPIGGPVTFQGRAVKLPEIKIIRWAKRFFWKFWRGFCWYFFCRVAWNEEPKNHIGTFPTFPTTMPGKCHETWTFQRVPNGS